MIKMTHSPSTSSLRSDYDTFLFASIVEDRNGMLLSVFSALARRDVDPWEQAAKLARLPVETAAQILASLIAPLPDEPPLDLDSLAISTRLIALLPRGIGSNIEISLLNRLVGMGTLTRAKIVVMCAIIVALMAGFHFITVRHEPQAQVDAIGQTKAN